MFFRKNVQATLRQYLLGRLDDDASSKLEARLLTDDVLYEELEAIQDDTMDEYLSGELEKDDAAMFERRFLATPEGQQKLRFARALRNYIADVRPAELASTRVAKTQLWSWPQLLSGAYVKAFALVLIVIVAGIGIWRIFFYQSDIDKGLLAFQAAYRDQRPLEARITQLPYAPFVVTRGNEPQHIDQFQLRRAEVTLLDVLHTSSTPAAQHALGKVYLAKKEFPQAIQQFEAALANDANNAQLYADLGAAWLEKGKADLANASAAGQGMEELGRGLENLNKAVQLNSGLLEALFNKALTEQQMKLYEQAETDWQNYLERDSTSPWAEEARKNLKALGERKATSANSKEQLIRDFQKAFAQHDETAAWRALSVSRSRTGNFITDFLIDEHLRLANSNQNDEAAKMLEGLVFAGQIERQQANDNYTSDLAQSYHVLNKAERETRSRARELLKEAIDLYNKAEWAQAIAMFAQSRELLVGSQAECEAFFAESFIGYCYLRIPEPEKATAVFERLSKTFGAKNYRSLFAQALLALADAANGRNQFSQALERASHSLVISEQIQDFANAIRCLQAQTSGQLVIGNYRDSLDAAYRALRVSENLPPDAKLLWPLYHESALDFYFLGFTGVALQFESEALRLALENNLTLQASRSYDRLALLHERSGNLTEALRVCELARQTGLKIGDERGRTNVLAHSALNLGRLFRESKQPQRAISSFDEALDLYQKLNLNIYQYQARKGKLLAYLDLHDDAAAEAELAPVIYWFEQNRKQIAEESYRNKFFDTDQNTYDLAIDFYYSRKHDGARAFDYAESSRARSLLDLMNAGSRIIGDAQTPDLQLANANTPLKIEQIQPQLPDAFQLLEYSVLDDKVVIWIVTRDKFHWFHTDITRGELERRVKDYREAISPAGGSAETNRQAQALYQALIAPIAEHLNPGYQLCIVPDGVLNFLPFAALVSPTSGKFLVEDYALVTSPSATVFLNVSAAAARKPTTVSERALIVGNPSFDRKQFADLPELPEAGEEAMQIAKLYGTEALTGDAAGSERVKNEIRLVDVVHLATHAIADERSPLLSKLLLSTEATPGRNSHHAVNGVLQASEIYGMKLPRLRLVALSACQTGIERAYRGEGAIGLARPFIAAGVPLVVASLWPVESATTAELMISFHKHRKQAHVSTVVALQRAQVEMLHNRQPNSQPNYGWAAFVAIGGHAGF